MYALGEWASRYDPSQVGLAADDLELLNDDRVGRMLARLFDADRASLLTRLVLDAVATFDIDLDRLHNDSTSITLSGAYDTADGHIRGGKPTPAASLGFNKDHRPDLKQLVWILTVSADGAVPLTFRVMDGNTADVTTHIDTFDDLVALTGNAGWLYVSDSKLATFDNARHIHTRGGRFLSVLPASRRENRLFRDWVVTNRPEWSVAQSVPSRAPDTPDDILSTYEDHLPSADGHRLIWIHSTAKARRDATRRHARIAKAITAIDALNSRLASPRCRIKTVLAAETEARDAIEAANATRWVNFAVGADTHETFWGAPRVPDSRATRVPRSEQEMKLSKQRRQYSPEYRDEAVKLVIETSRPIVTVADELGINAGTLGNWVNLYRQEHADDEPMLDINDRARLRQVERELREANMEIAFLKKAAAYFAQIPQ